VALGIWAAGWGLEVVADRQKSAWRARKDAGEHNEGFNHDGVWTWSRHPK
jgi:steroid 5-alpha reductase family enzyme